MAYNPSKRIKAEGDEELNLNLNPMMDMFAVLIPALLMMSAVVEVSVINVSSPSIGPPSGAAEKAPDTPPLNLRVTIMESGYLISSSVGPSPGGTPGMAPEGGKGPTIPIVDKQILCSRYRGTWPPPRSKNKERPKCAEDRPMDRKSFWVYDLDALRAKAMEFKTAFPTERRVIIEGGPDIEYESIVDAMDATRDYKENNGDLRALFDEVVVSPGVL